MSESPRAYALVEDYVEYRATPDYFSGQPILEQRTVKNRIQFM